MIDIVVAYIVPVVHVFACLFLIVVVLLQTGKGADMGAVFGGGSQTLFGSGGAGNLLTKLTTGTAIAFMVTSLILGYAYKRAPSSTLLDRIPADAAAPAVPRPPTPAPNTAATGGVTIPVAPAPAAPNAATGGVAIPVVPAPAAPNTATGNAAVPVAPAPAAPADAPAGGGQ